MKTKYFLLVAVTIMVLAASSSCKKPITKKPISYIFICDTVTDQTVLMFHDLLFKPWMGKEDPLAENAPDGHDDITFNLYDLSRGDNPSAISAVFPHDNDDDKGRKEIANEFISNLAPVKGNENNSKNLLHTISNVLKQITDRGTDYHVIIYSKMIENSGGPILDPGANSNWKDGRFHFVNVDNNCITQELNAARAQVDSSRDWIYNNITNIQHNDSDFSRYHVKVSIYQIPSGIISTPDFPYGENNVTNFWTALFSKINIKVRNCGIKPSLQNVLVQ